MLFDCKRPSGPVPVGILEGLIFGWPLPLCGCRSFGGGRSYRGFVGRCSVLGQEFPESGLVAAAGGKPGDKVAEVFFIRS